MSAALIACLLASSAWLDTASAGAAGRCQAEPVGTVTAFVEDAGDSTSVGFTGVVTERRPAEGPGLERLRIRDASGRERRLAFSAPGESLPVRVGGRYGFRVEHQGEAPRCSAILLWDRGGLLYAAAADSRPGGTVMREARPFSVALEPRRCESRPHDSCFDGLYNRALRVAFGARAVTLMHGEEASLGAWRVRCLTAQEAVANSHCADAALIGVAYTLRRMR